MMNFIKTILLGGAFILAAPLEVGAETTPPTRYGPPITVNAALALIKRGMEAGSAQGLNMAFAVVEPSGELVAFARMEDVPYASTELAQQKARSSARLRLATSDLETRVQNGRTVLLSSDEVLAVGGGVPIVVDGRVVGALGVSGGTSSQDAEMAHQTLAGQ
ncbi:MAG TPA: heme-binding protein [Asticcacaulis sp.]|nr:heme-binding protein [Asticcacaulis sp.]